MQNETLSYYAPISLVDEVDQLNLTVAYSSLNTPVADNIVTWQDPGGGIYPLSTNRGSTNASSAKVSLTGDFSAVNSLELTQVGANPGATPANTVWLNSGDGHLYRGAVDLENTGGDVVGPASADANNIVLFDGTTGKLIKEVQIRAFQPSQHSYIFTNNQPATMTGTQNVAIGSFCLTGITTGTNNYCLSFNQQSITTGSDNVIINGGGSLATSDSNNIVISNAGVGGDNNTIRIGNTQTSAHIAGVYQAGGGSGVEVVTMNNANKLGSVTFLAVQNDYTVLNVAASPTNLAKTDSVVIVDSSTIPITLNLPAATNKMKLKIIDNGNAAAQNITIVPNGADTIIGGASYTINGNYDSVNLITDGVSKWYIC